MITTLYYTRLSNKPQKHDFLKLTVFRSRSYSTDFLDSLILCVTPIRHFANELGDIRYHDLSEVQGLIDKYGIDEEKIVLMPEASDRETLIQRGR